MTILTLQSPLQLLADIMHAAAVFGSDGFFQSGGSASPVPPSIVAHDLLAFFEALQQRDISYLLVSGVALLRYVDGRNTDDLDLIIAFDDAVRVPELVMESRNVDAARARFRSLRIDLLLSTNAVFRHAKEHHATHHQFAEFSVPCATAAGLALLKLYALPSLYRQGDLQRAALYETDILMLSHNQKLALDPLVLELEPHLAPADLASHRDIIHEINQRLERMKQSGSSGT